MSVYLDQNSEFNLKDKSCGVSVSEFTSQTTQIVKFEKSSEAEVRLVDIGLNTNDNLSLSLSSSSQIPRLEMLSKTTGNEYSDKATYATLQTDSKYAEVKLSEDDFSDTTLENIRTVIRQELLRLQKFVHNVRCTGCENAYIVGDRYKCTVCENFNLCSICEENTQHEHSLLKIKLSALIKERPELSLEKLQNVGVLATAHKPV